MDNQRIHLQHVITVKKMVVQMILQIEICSVFANGTTTITTIRNWFKRFRAGNFDLKGEGCNGRRATTDTDLMKAILAENSQYNVCEIVSTTNIPKQHNT